MSLETTPTTAEQTPVAPVAEAAKPVETPKQEVAPVKSEAPAKSEDELLAEIYREANTEDGNAKQATGATGDDPAKPLRNERGQFQSSKPAEEQPEAQTPGQEGKPADANIEAKEPAKNAFTEGHFRGWNDAKKQAFGKLPPEAQEFAIAHQRDLQSQHSKREQDFRRFEQSAKPLVETVQKYGDYLDQVSHALQRPPHEIISGLMETERTLRFGTFQDKVETLLGMARDYGIPLQLPDDETALSSGLDPRVHDLHQENARLRAAQDQDRRRAEQQREQQATYQIGAALDSMRTATDTNGQPLYPHFELHAPRMGQLIASGAADSLEDAYRIADEPMRKAVEAEVSKKAGRQSLESATRLGRLNVTTAPTPINRFDSEEEMLRASYRQAMTA